MTSEEILELLKYGERITLECKKAEPKLPNSLWETYSAFANTDGGIILFGVEEHMREIDFTKRFSFVSIKNPDQRLRDFWNTINGQKASSNILVDADVGTCVVNDATIMWVRVPRANYKQRPIYINENPIKGSFKRNHEGDYHCTEDEVKAMLRDASDSGNDGGLLNGYTIDDIDVNALRSYRIEFEHRNPDHVWNGIDDQTFLKNIGGYAKDRDTGKEWLTAAGLLMFGKGIAVRERFDNIRMDYIDESNLIPGSRWSDRLTYDGMWENNLYNFMRQVIPKLVSDLKRPFRMEGMVRVDDTPVHKAIREAIVNMMIHADYLVTGILKIVKSDKGFLFSNPGNLKLPVQAIYEGGHSVARNPRIQTMFRMIGYGDNIGSGFPTILSAWGNENWRKPDLTQSEELHQVDLKLWMISLMPPECTEGLKNLYGWIYSKLDKNEQIILGTAYLEKEVTNVRMQSILELNSIEIGHSLSSLVEKEMLVINKNGRWTSYRLNEDYHIPSEQLAFTDIVKEDVHFKNESDRLIYDYAKANGFITTHQILEITKITTNQGANVALNRLIELGYIKRVREGRHFIYQVVK
ncbi:MAG: putative DNA binding domain-containing protein [Lachnospiraceae bacterium]|nr:putative DNA binding domain-containing protein [Lachnospiraceae bacterium]